MLASEYMFIVAVGTVYSLAVLGALALGIVVFSAGKWLIEQWKRTHRP